MNTLKVAGIQMGPYAGDYQTNMNNALKALDQTVIDFKPDVVCFSEVMTAPCFWCTYDDKYFELAEPVYGKTAEIISNAAKKHGIYIIATLFEKTKNKYYNSAFLVSPTGKVVGTYRKVHLSKSNDRKIIPVDEQYYFSPGDKFPIFDLYGIPVGILICFDRSITESFRVLALKGAKIVFVPTATFRKDLFWEELRVRAAENRIFVIAVNKAGDEICVGEEQSRHYFGNSCIIEPTGKISASIEDKPFGALTGEVNLSIIDVLDKIGSWRSFRKPKLYKIISQSNIA